MSVTIDIELIHWIEEQIKKQTKRNKTIAMTAEIPIQIIAEISILIIPQSNLCLLSSLVLLLLQNKLSFF